MNQYAKKNKGAKKNKAQHTNTQHTTQFTFLGNGGAWVFDDLGGDNDRAVPLHSPVREVYKVAGRGRPNLFKYQMVQCGVGVEFQNLVSVIQLRIARSREEK